MAARLRKFLKRFHPEGIPWPASVLYNALSSTNIFLRHYEMVSEDIASYGPAEHILDIGTGPGNLLPAMRKVFPNARLVGVDISRAMVEQARRNMERRGADPLIEFKTASADALPFADGTFDCVVSTGSLHHWKNSIQALSEANRVLKPGGHALIYDLVRNMPPPVRAQVSSQFGTFRMAMLWVHSFEEPFLDLDEMIALGKQSEFAVEGTRFVGVFCCLILKKDSVSTLVK